MKKDENILIGYSGHAYVVADAALQNSIRIKHYADLYKQEFNPFDLKYIGNESKQNFQCWGKGYGFILGIGNNKKRLEIANLILSREEKLVTIVHPRSAVSDFATIGEGSFIAAQSAVNAFAFIGNSVIINTNSVVEHECKIDDGAHIAPGTVLAGNVKVGKRSLIGANSVVKEGISIGSDVTVGAGSTILNDIPDGKTVVGNPAREI